MPPDTVLPLEIIREVFSHIDDDDKRTLSAVAQTSSRFRLDMQNRTFQSVHLDYLMGRDPCSVGGIWLLDLHPSSRSVKLLASITKRPHLGALVRRFSLKGLQTRAKAIIQPSAASLVDMLPRLTRLEHFTFEAPDSGPITFSHLAMPIQSAICKAMQKSKALTRLDLCGLCSVPSTLVVQSANIVDLTIVSVISNNTGASGAYSTSISPRHLKICTSVPWSTSSDQLDGVAQLLKDSSLSLTNLHTLEVEAQHTDKMDIEYLLSRVAKGNLRTLTLSRPQMDAHESNDNSALATISKGRHAIDLHAFRSLAGLNLSMGQLYTSLGRGDGKTPIPWVTAILKTLPDFSIDGARRPRLRLRLDGNLLSTSCGQVKDIPWGLVAKVLLSRQYEFEEVEIRTTILSRRAEANYTSVTPTQETIEALKSHPGIRMMKDFVQFQYLVEVMDV